MISLATVECSCVVEDYESLAREREHPRRRPVFPLRKSQDRPVEVDIVPARCANLTRARDGENEEFQGEHEVTGAFWCCHRSTQK